MSSRRIAIAIQQFGQYILRRIILKPGFAGKLFEGVSEIVRPFQALPNDLKFGCLHPVACTRSGSGFPSTATLF
jgi:hypothetical protein